MNHLCITVRWLDSRYHGLLDRSGPPEWPPSPFRLFQALLAGVARRGEIGTEIADALRWLEGKSPLIIAPHTKAGQVITHFVPNNDCNKVPDRQNRLTAKTAHPTLMLQQPVVNYVWQIPDECPHLPGLVEAAGYLFCLGWGIDMAFARAQVLSANNIEQLSGIRWVPRPHTARDDGLLRVPKGGSMEDLRRAHQSALERIKEGKPLSTIDKPRQFDYVFYTSPLRPIGRPSKLFSLIGQPHPHAKTICMAAMLRHAAKKAMENSKPAGVNEGWLESFVVGHRPDDVETHERFSYIPLPSIGHPHADAMIRRAMITAPFGHDSELQHLANQLQGIQLEPEDGRDGPYLEHMRSDTVTRLYLEPSRHWASVTPVILPGHNDHKLDKTVKLIQRALQQSGIDQSCEFTWSALPNFPHCPTAHKYDQNGRRTGYQRPKYLESLTAVHLRLTFEYPVAGPLCLGAGRHCGLGILASIPESGRQ